MKATSQPRDTQQASLFGSTFAEWKKDADRAFDHWLARRGVSESSAKVYGFMWHKWMRWTRERKLPITAWEAHHIAAFLDESALHKNHRYRYARLIERVFQHLATLRPGMHNPASVAVRQKLADGENAPTTFLAESERIAIEQCLTNVPALPRNIAVNGPEWRLYRDMALLALFYGAGIKVAQAKVLKRDAVSGSAQTIVVPQKMGKRVYQTRVELLEVARPAVRAWARLLVRVSIPGDWLFTSDLAGRAMHAASMFRRVTAQLEALGIADGRASRLSPQTLRNTYAAIRFDRGDSLEEVAGALGFVDEASPYRLHRGYVAWKDGQAAVVEQTAASTVA
ncbi:MULTISPECIES: tyrosine-type recombinase/integrase [unclassified Cupriavidus]|uniref:tyrosine-type recombinase/integrase n=1 Tax=unclassified Cupriavidus TaxID=2640874 RepID=UPI00313B15FC